MRIASSNVTMSSSHVAAKRSTHKESLRAWVGERRPAFEALDGRRDRGRNRGLPGRGEEDGGPDRGRDGGGESRRSLDARRIAGLAMRLERQAAAQVQRNVETASQAPKGTNSKDDGEDDALDGDPKALAIKLIVEAWTGKRIKIVSLEGVGKATANAEAAASEIQQATQQQQQRVGWGVEYELHETHHEYEQTSFAAQGVVKTADGKEIRFNYELEMEREFCSTTDQVASLKERNVGAIGLGQLATPFELMDADNQLQGVVRSSGIYVKEDGSGVGSVQQIDLAV